MNKDLFASMRSQLSPSPEARAALEKKLSTPRKKHGPGRRYVALAACAAVIIAAFPLYRIYQESGKWHEILTNFQKSATVADRHSYVTAESSGACWTEDAAVEENSAVTGDEDADMTPGELTDNMLRAGFISEDVDAYLASGWQMTWAKWWKFYHLSEESGDRSLDALRDFSQAEGLAVNTGDAPAAMPDGAFASDAPAQENAVMAYQNLMTRFEADYGPGRYPEWYGGAYIDNGSDCLIVNIVEGSYSAAFYSRIQDWAGSGSIAFGSGKYSLNFLRDLQARAFDAMCGLGLAVSCGVNEETGQVDMSLASVTDEALVLLARMDPEDDAIHLTVVQQNTVLTETPAVSYTIQSGGRPEDVDPDDAIAFEPQG